MAVAVGQEVLGKRNTSISRRDSSFLKAYLGNFAFNLHFWLVRSSRQSPPKIFVFLQVFLVLAKIFFGFLNTTFYWKEFYTCKNFLLIVSHYHFITLWVHKK